MSDNVLPLPSDPRLAQAAQWRIRLTEAGEETSPAFEMWLRDPLNRAAWDQGVMAYQTVRPLSPGEHALVLAFDESSVLMSGLMWLEWVFQAGRTFDDPAQVLERVRSIAARLARRAR